MPWSRLAMQPTPTSCAAASQLGFVHIQVKTYLPGNKTCSVGVKAEKVVLNYDTYDRNETAVFKFGLQDKKDLSKMQKYCN